MNRSIRSIKFSIAIVVLVAIFLLASGVMAEKPAHKPITQKLITLLESNPDIKAMLVKSLAKAKAINPDPKTNPAQTLEDYYNFIDSASELIPQEVLDNPSDIIRQQILQSICYFYFLIDQPLDELKDKKLYKNTIQYYGPFATWTREFANAWGQFLDTEASWNEETYKQFYNDPAFGLQKGWYEPATNWNTFNRFFARYLKTPDVRPIADADDPSVVTSPADSVPQGVWPIDDKSNIKVNDGLKVKLATYYNIEDLLGKDSKYKDAFAGGVLTHTFLNVFDYHRYHFAVGGKVLEKNILQRNVTLEVSWNAKEKKYDPIDSTGWQFYQTLGYVVVDTGEYGLVALIPMGMAQVSSVNFEKNVQVGETRKKGDMLGNFLFGGSDFIILFQDKAGFELVTPIEKPAEGCAQPEYKHILMGTKYGVLKEQKK